MAIISKVFTFKLQKSQNHYKMECSLVFKRKNIKKVLRAFMPPPSTIKESGPPVQLGLKTGKEREIERE